MPQHNDPHFESVVLLAAQQAGASLQRTRTLTVLSLCYLDGDACHLTYRDGDGVVSTRTVTPQAFTTCKNGAFVMRCWDHNRKAKRTFRMDRVIHAEQA